MSRFKLVRLWLPLIAAVGGAVVGAVVAGVFAILERTEPPVARGYCDKTEVRVGEVFECNDVSLNADTVQWDFGDKKGNHPGERKVVYSYDIPGTYRVSIVALRAGHDADEYGGIAPITVTEEDGLSPPLTVRIVASSPKKMLQGTKTCEIHQTKDDHPETFSSHSRYYEFACSADAGFTIESARFNEQSANNWADRSVNVDGNRAVLRFRLESGPAIDRWRGWLHGTIELDQRREQAGEEIELVDQLRLDTFGTYQLPRVHLDAIEKVTIYNVDTSNVISTGQPGTVLQMASLGLGLKIATIGDETLLEIRRLK